ncbi:MAG: SAM-dependent methyltransferase [Brevundimonas sp.]|jgi:SAM-dependent methyltransferase|uniref:SAM-dependent methyltransferase n=1 Tax=Brevundimonas sp. TaxID=1871086 RepID=UPI0039E49267
MTPEQARAFWDSRYGDESYLFGERPNAFLERQADRLRPGMTVLAVADGEGRNGVWLARQGLTVTSTDISPKAVAKARALAARHGVEIDAQLADLDAWDWPVGAFDVVVGVFVQFAPPAMRDRLFARMKQALKPGGLLLLEGYRPEQLAYGTGGPGQVENLYTEALLRDAFADMTGVELASYDAGITEGAGHSGLSALIDLVAIRPEPAAS